jgi:arginine decarboxylase
MLGVNYTRFFLTAGSGVEFTGLNSFDVALLNSGVGNTNLIKMSSILPPRVVRVLPETIPEGDLVPLAYADFTHSYDSFVAMEAVEISAAVAVGIPADPNLAGLIMEHSGFFEDEKTCEQMVIKMVERGMGYRNRPVKDIRSISISLRIKGCVPYGSVFAAVVLLP